MKEYEKFDLSIEHKNVDLSTIILQRGLPFIERQTASVDDISKTKILFMLYGISFSICIDTAPTVKRIYTMAGIQLDEKDNDDIINFIDNTIRRLREESDSGSFKTDVYEYAYPTVDSIIKNMKDVKIQKFNESEQNDK